MIASIVWDVDPILFKVGSWEVRWYGLMWGIQYAETTALGLFQYQGAANLLGERKR